MRDTPYHSTRMGLNESGSKIELNMLKRLFLSTYDRFFKKDYFHQYFGYTCTSVGSVNGELGSDIEAILLHKLGENPDKCLWPIRSSIESYSEDDLFDVMEFTYDCISKPMEEGKWYHDYFHCGWHYKNFDATSGQEEYRKELNSILKDYQAGYELSKDGNIIIIVDTGFENLLDAKIPSDNNDIHTKINHAILKFRLYKSSLQDRRDAIRALADILEYLRPEAKKILTKKDDADIFQLANEFGIRHHNQIQQDQYNKPIWYCWLFYFYLATIHAVLRLIEEKNANNKSL